MLSIESIAAITSTLFAVNTLVTRVLPMEHKILKSYGNWFEGKLHDSVSEIKIIKDVEKKWTWSDIMAASVTLGTGVATVYFINHKHDNFIHKCIQVLTPLKKPPTTAELITACLMVHTLGNNVYEVLYQLYKNDDSTVVQTIGEVGAEQGVELSDGGCCAH